MSESLAMKHSHNFDRSTLGTGSIVEPGFGTQPYCCLSLFIKIEFIIKDVTHIAG